MKRLFIFIISAFLLFTLVGCGSSGNTSNVDETSEETENSEESEVPTLGEKMKQPEREEEIKAQRNMTIGDTGTVDGVEMTLTRVYLTEGNEYAQSELTPGHIYMVCEFNIVNGSQENINPWLYSYEMYANDQQCNTAGIVVENAMLDINDLAPGKTAVGAEPFEVPQDANSFELRIRTDFSNEDEKDELIYKFDTTQITQ